MGRAIFVSHQWLGQDHPDPDSRFLFRSLILSSRNEETTLFAMDPYYDNWQLNLSSVIRTQEFKQTRVLQEALQNLLSGWASAIGLCGTNPKDDLRNHGKRFRTPDPHKPYIYIYIYIYIYRDR